MEKYYISNEILKYNLEVKENSTIIFEMPSFCSGDYFAKVYKDELGLFINKKDNYFNSCRDLFIEK